MTNRNLTKRLQPQPGHSEPTYTSWPIIALTAIISACLALLAERQLHLITPHSTHSQGLKANDRRQSRCRPPLPNLFVQDPVLVDRPELQSVLQAVDLFVRESFAANEIDGLAVAVVTADDVLYETGLGPLKANETDPVSRGTVDRHSIFRIASGSKLFTALEVLALREKGALQWDDPVERFFPEFTYADGGWADTTSSPSKSKIKAPITLRQLASHMSGLTREYPRGDMKDWPHSLEGLGPPPLNGCPFPTTAEMIKGLSQYPLVVPTYSYPVYSNAGFAVLGQAAVAANAAFEKQNGILESPTTWRALAKRDIFDPLGLNGSSFVVTSENSAHVAVAALNSDEVDMDFLEPMSCSGGQMSSLSDYIKLMQTILDPTRPESLLPPQVIREWMRPLHGWTDETTEVGMLWEIEKIYDSHKRPIRIFQKLGVLGASRSVFAVNQDMSYGIALLMTGPSVVAGDIVLDIFRLMQPTLDRILADEVAKLYSGRWVTNDTEESLINIVLNDGSLWITTLVLHETDVLRLTQGITNDTQKAMPINLWSTGRHHEFRMLFGAAEEFGAVSYATCVRYWISIDSGFSRGYPMDLLYFQQNTHELSLHIPSSNVTLTRQR